MESHQYLPRIFTNRFRKLIINERKKKHIYKLLIYQVKELVAESSIEASGKNLVHILRCGWRQMKPLFMPSNILRLILITSIQFGATLGCVDIYFFLSESINRLEAIEPHTTFFALFYRSNSLRLWMPQLFAMIETYEQLHPTTASQPKPTMCHILEATKQTANDFNSTNATISGAPVCTAVSI